MHQEAGNHHVTSRSVGGSDRSLSNCSTYTLDPATTSYLSCSTMHLAHKNLIISTEIIIIFCITSVKNKGRSSDFH